MPALEGTIMHLTAKDRTNLAEGYYHVYQAYKKIGKADAYNFLMVAYTYDGEEILSQYSKKIDKTDLKKLRNLQ